MATSVLARTVGDSWRGVAHRFDSAPWDLGNALLMGVTDTEDLERFVRELIDESPGGWECWPTRTRMESEPAYYTPADVEDAAWIDWFYWFDPDGRWLRCYRGGPPGRGGTLEAEIRFAGRGSTPPAFEPPNPPWWKLPEATDWEGDHREVRRMRARFCGLMEAWCSREGVTVDEARARIVDWLALALETATFAPPDDGIRDRVRARLGQLGLTASPAWRPPETGDDALRAAGGWSHDTRYWRVQLGDHTLLYLSGNAPRRPTELRLWRRDGCLGFLLELEPSGDPALFDAIQAAMGYAHNPHSHRFRVEPDGIYVAKEVVDGANGPNQVDRGWLQGEAPALGEWVFVHAGEHLDLSLLLDWLRLGQVPDPTLHPETQGITWLSRYWTAALEPRWMHYLAPVLMGFGDWWAGVFYLALDAPGPYRVVSLLAAMFGIVPMFFDRATAPLQRAAAIGIWLALALTAVGVALAGGLAMTPEGLLGRGVFGLAVVAALWDLSRTAQLLSLLSDEA